MPMREYISHVPQRHVLAIPKISHVIVTPPEACLFFHHDAATVQISK